MAQKLAKRFVWAVNILDIQPDDQVLEVGCGHGIAAALICERLKDGRLTAIDQSAKMIEVAQRRNSACVAAGKASFSVMALKDVRFPDAAFNKIFAINVNVFWLKPSTELAVIQRTLAPDGMLYLFYEPPAPEKAQFIAAKVEETLTAAAFNVENVIMEEGPTGHLLCIRATIAK